MVNNPFLLKKKTKKHSMIINSPSYNKSSLKSVNSDSKQKESNGRKNSLKDPNLITTGRFVKNPVIYPSDFKKFVKNNKLTLSPNDFNKMSSKKHRTIASFDDRLNLSNKKSLKEKAKSMFELRNKPILRWDNLTFVNKNNILKQELKNIKKHFKDKKLLKSINNYQKSMIESDNLTSISKRKNSATSEYADTNREDMFGNKILKGGSKHRVSFSFKGDLKIVENWKKINKKLKIEPDFNNVEDEEDKKKKCRIF
jgi:hypothetical protein